MFVPMPIPPPAPVPQYVYNRYEQLDPELESNQFVASEGTYKALEEISLAFPAAHPSEPAPNPNPLTPQAGPLHSGVHLSVISFSGTPHRKAVRTPSHGDIPIVDRVEENKDSLDDDSTSSTDGDNTEQAIGSLPPTPGIPQGINDLHRASSGSIDLSTSQTSGRSIFDNVYDPYAKRKKRLGTSANGTTSTFVSRAITDPNLASRLNEHKAESYFVLGNVGRGLSWLDLGSSANLKHEPLSKLMFSLSTVVCHDANQLTKSIRGVDVVLGMSTGDICWYDPVSTRYLRYNKQRCINASAVTQIQWLPGSDTLFMAAHADGALIIYDKERDDGEFLAALSTGHSNADESEYFPVQESSSPMSVLKSAHDTRLKTNPVSYLALSRQAVNAFAFSPDQVHLALVSDDGCLKVIDYRREKLLDVYSSYYGGLTSVCWSPDGHYIVTGGKDDLVTIWSFVERRIIARCHGHSSFVTGVAFDEYMCDDFNYRFGSISEDGKLCLWDFALSSLHKPSSKASKNDALQMPATAHRPIISDAHESQPVSTIVDGIAFHKVESRLSTAILSPIAVKRVDDQPPSHLVFLKECILISTTGKKYGRIKYWKRPV